MSLLCYNFFTDAPILTLLPNHSPYYIDVDDKVQLKCIAEGLPLPTVQWFSNGIAVSSVGQPQASVTVPTSYPHTTVYTCEGINKFNKESSSVTVIVGGRIDALLNVHIYSTCTIFFVPNAA